MIQSQNFVWNSGKMISVKFERDKSDLSHASEGWTYFKDTLKCTRLLLGTKYLIKSGFL